MERSIDLRALFDSVRRPWKDRGRNCSRGNVNICCPFCPDDQGFHMAVAEHLNGAFYCYRRPQQHSGRNLRAVLVKLGTSFTEAALLLERFGGKVQQGGVAREAPVEAAKVIQAWERFVPTDESARAYLKSRGFPKPRALTERYDLRIAERGTWAKRLLFPIKQGNEVIAWTGRDIRGSSQMKYLTEKNGHEGLIYVPRMCRSTMFVHEGPMDALKVAAAGEELPISAMALTGKALNAEKMWHILQVCQRAKRIVLALDGDTQFAERSRMTAELRGAFSGREVLKAALPDGYKDAGEMPQAVASAWLATFA